MLYEHMLYDQHWGLAKPSLAIAGHFLAKFRFGLLISTRMVVTLLSWKENQVSAHVAATESTRGARHA
jgi:hypothetical protein